jgi:hypothetical protein
LYPLNPILSFFPKKYRKITEINAVSLEPRFIRSWKTTEMLSSTHYGFSDILQVYPNQALLDGKKFEMGELIDLALGDVCAHHHIDHPDDKLNIFVSAPTSQHGYRLYFVPLDKKTVNWFRFCANSGLALPGPRRSVYVMKNRAAEYSFRFLTIAEAAEFLRKTYMRSAQGPDASSKIAELYQILAMPKRTEPEFIAQVRRCIENFSSQHLMVKLYAARKFFIESCAYFTNGLKSMLSMKQFYDWWAVAFGPEATTLEPAMFDMFELLNQFELVYHAPDADGNDRVLPSELLFVGKDDIAIRPNASGCMIEDHAFFDRDLVAYLFAFYHSIFDVHRINWMQPTLVLQNLYPALTASTAIREISAASTKVAEYLFPADQTKAEFGTERIPTSFHIICHKCGKHIDPDRIRGPLRDHPVGTFGICDNEQCTGILVAQPSWATESCGTTSSGATATSSGAATAAATVAAQKRKGAKASLAPFYLTRVGDHVRTRDGPVRSSDLTAAGKLIKGASHITSAHYARMMTLAAGTNILLGADPNEVLYMTDYSFYLNYANTTDRDTAVELSKYPSAGFPWRLEQGTATAAPAAPVATILPNLRARAEKE